MVKKLYVIGTSHKGRVCILICLPAIIKVAKDRKVAVPSRISLTPPSAVKLFWKIPRKLKAANKKNPPDEVGIFKSVLLNPNKSAYKPATNHNPKNAQSDS